MLRFAASVLLLLLAATAGVARGAEVIPATIEAAPIHGGPVLAGDGVLWSEVGDRRERVHLRHGGSTRTLLDLPQRERYGWAEIAASREWFALLRLSWNKSDPTWPLDLHHGSHEGSTVEMPLCGGRSAVAITGRATALRCASKIVVSEDGERREHAIPEDAPFAIAGAFLAYRTREEVVVLDRTTGAERYRVAAPVFYWFQPGLSPGVDQPALDLREDGTVVFDTKERDVAWASEAEPRPHRLSLVGSDIRIAGDRVAAAERTNDQRDVRVQVRTLADEPLDRLEGLPWRAWDFDGRRLAWRVRPCALSSVVVIAVGERVPDVGSRCETPRSRAGRSGSGPTRASR